MSKSASYYIENNDFEGAKLRFENSNVRWLDHWFNTCKMIYDSCKDWAKKYILDPIAKTISHISECIKKVRTTKNSTSNTYLIKMFDTCGNWVFTKIGKADILSTRLKKLGSQYYARDGVQIGHTEIIKSYEVPNDDCAQILESLMRNYFRKTKHHIPNDRFEPFEPTEEDLQIFEKYYNLTLANA